MVKRPEWTPADAGSEFASQILPASKRQSGASSAPVAKTKHYDYAAIKAGIVNGDRTCLAKGITLVESNSEKHFAIAQELLNDMLPYAGKAVRIGISGIPGAGKSTLIESLGLRLINAGHKVAVLAVDPSSVISKGSILGDKTRMEGLSRSESSFIRPSPSGGVLGGVARKTRESIILCEAAGYDYILVETVGVGQSEITVRSMVDFFVLMQIAGAGDELQGIKKGIMELADLILVNKADGDNVLKAQKTASELNTVLHYLKSDNMGWKPRAMTCSALHGDSLAEMLSVIEAYFRSAREDGKLEQRRQQQTTAWFDCLLNDAVQNLFHNKPMLRDLYRSNRNKVADGLLNPTFAVKQLIELIYKEG